MEKKQSQVKNNHFLCHFLFSLTLYGAMIKSIVAISTVLAVCLAHGVHMDTWAGIESIFTDKKGPHATSGFWLAYIFDKLFPFGPAGNAILATTYISGPPNLILAFIPGDIDMSSLSLLVSFAIGGLLGDVFIHLLPQTFTGQKVDIVVNGDAYVIINEMRNVVLGVSMFVGFFLFFLIDKSLRILQHEPGHSHGHSHSSKETPSNEVKPSVYLNLISDFTHNITDGLAIASSFYISKNVGCTTAIATFMHEIPHEVGDFALLIQGGFSKWQAMNSQFITALGAYLGTFIGIALQERMNGMDITIGGGGNDLWGSGVNLADLTLPFTAGGFLYISFSVIPELLELEEGSSRVVEVKRLLAQVFWMFVGIGLMVVIAICE